MTDFKRDPRVLIVTPEIAYLPHGMDNVADYLTAKASGLADVSAALINALFEQGADVYVSIPDYRSMFNGRLPAPQRRELRMSKIRVPEERLHLAEDSAFFYLHGVYSNYWWENRRRALAFQREIINTVIPYVQPDLIHCYDCMTGLIPAMARQRGIPCLFTFHNLQTVKCPLSRIEDRGIDAAEFWQHLYFERMPCNYEETRESNPVDFLASGIFAAHFVNTVSPAFLIPFTKGASCWRISFITLSPDIGLKIWKWYLWPVVIFRSISKISYSFIIWAAASPSATTMNDYPVWLMQLRTLYLWPPVLSRADYPK